MTKNTNEQLIQDNYRNVYALAHSLAKSYNLAFEAFEDLQKVGYISLIEQSKTFDENSGVPFWTYACKGVKLKMLEELRFILDTVSISPYLNKQIGKVRKIVSANAESNTSELIEIVSQILKISADKSEELLILSTKEKTRRCKKKRNKARGFPRYGSPRALIYHTAKKNYLILKKGYSKHTGRNTALFADY
ncbi:sigma factor [Ruminococcus sp.]|uniref:sigma factor n=1 Tax=Ruminococcus sp. TaxID=41978 RepID=UPI003AB2DA6F